MRTEYPVEFFIEINRMAISIKPSEIDLAGLVRSESDLYFLGLKLESCDDIFEKAANALYGIAYYHPFYEGNKRTALLTCELLLDGLRIAAAEKEIYHFVLDVACGRVDVDSITKWLRKNTH